MENIWTKEEISKLIKYLIGKPIQYQKGVDLYFCKSNFNTKYVTNMDNMFSQCYALDSLNLSNYNTQNVTNMAGMFSSCEALKSLNLSNFNTPKLENIEGMFRE